MRILLALACALGLAGCTPGADHPAPAAPLPSAPLPSNAPSVVTIDVNLTLNAATSIAPGTSGGFRPALTTVTVGTPVRFMNSDGFSHTATSLGAGTTFPGGSPLGTSALTQNGSLLSQGFSSGVLQAGASSQTLIADQAGTYLYGCFFHYGAPMRAAIVVQ